MNNKEIQLTIKICENNRSEFTPHELASYLNIKFTENVYSHISQLVALGIISKKSKGVYQINDANPKVRDVRTLIDIFGPNARFLLSNNTKRVLERFAEKPILKTSDLPYQNLKIVKDIVKKSRVLYSTKDGKSELFFIRCWEEPTIKLLDFFGIILTFDQDAFRRSVVKHYSAFTTTQQKLIDSHAGELAKLNMEAYVRGEDYVLSRLSELSSYELKVSSIITDDKRKKILNPFEFAQRITDWKIRYVYNTDKIEGNPLTADEVRTILTIGAGDLEKREKKAVLETINSRTAVDNIFELSHDLTVEFVKKLHYATQVGIEESAGEYKRQENCIVDAAGHLIDTTTPAGFVQERMNQLIDWHYKNCRSLHPLAVAAVVHNQFVLIHPFEDGNGRVARLLFNFILVKNGFYPIIFFSDQKERYYSALRNSKTRDMKTFIQYVFDLYREQIDDF